MWQKSSFDKHSPEKEQGSVRRESGNQDYRERQGSPEEPEDFRLDISGFSDEPDEAVRSEEEQRRSVPPRYRGESYTRERYEKSLRKEKKKKERREKGHKGLVALLIVIWAIIAIGAVVFFVGRHEVTTLKTMASEVKDELKGCVTAAKEMDPEGIVAGVENIRKKDAAIVTRLENPFWSVVSIIPYYGEDVATVKDLMTTLDEMADGILLPLADVVRNYPISDLRVNESDVNVALILHYLDFLDSVEPQMETVASKLQDTELHAANVGFSEYAEKIQTASHKLATLNVYKGLLRSFLGNGENRFYILMAQNTSETRAGGGFPGSVGTIKIQDGLLSIGDFTSVYNVIYNGMLPECNVTYREIELYQYFYEGQIHDSTFNPHFPKAAYMMKLGYEAVNEEYVDGVISLTPQIIQDILAVTGNSFFLDDGTYVDGTNATRTIERQLYLNYMADSYSEAYNDPYVDLLFAQTASLAMKAMFENLSPETLLKYVDVVEAGFAERTVMIWMDDDGDQQICMDAGASGSLNFDPANPQLGVYFSLCDACKMGMFLEIDTSISDPVELPDGSKEYQVTTVLNNYYGDVGYDITSMYILGNYNGGIRGYVYFFGPAGGTISDFTTSNWSDMQISEYEGLQVGYLLDVLLWSGDPLTVSYKVTTAPGAGPLTLSTTPTLQNYR